MLIQILGSGCPSCRTLEANARKAVEGLGIDARIEKVTDMDMITEMGVMFTPAIAIDGTVRESGKVLGVDEITSLLK